MAGMIQAFSQLDQRVLRRQGTLFPPAGSLGLSAGFDLGCGDPRCHLVQGLLYRPEPVTFRLVPRPDG